MILLPLFEEEMVFSGPITKSPNYLILIPNFVQSGRARMSENKVNENC